MLWNRIGAWLNAGCPHGPEADAMAAALEHWLQRYRAQWRQVSKESSLSVLTNLICRYADLLRGGAGNPAVRTERRVGILYDNQRFLGISSIGQ